MVLLARAGVPRCQDPPEGNRIARFPGVPVAGSVCEQVKTWARSDEGRGGRARNLAAGESWGMIALSAQGRCAHLRMHAPWARGKFRARFGAG